MSVGDEVGGRVADHHLDAERFGPGGDDGDRLRMALGVDEEDVPRVLGGPAQQGHRLGGRGALVEHGGVGDLHAGEVAHHRLEVEERLEPALADLGLVGRVGGVPGRVLEHVAQDDARGVGAVVALPDEGREHLVPVGERPQAGDRLGLGQGVLDVEGLVVADRARDGLIEEVVERRHPEGREHAVDLVGRRSDVAVGELLGAGVHGGAPGFEGRVGRHARAGGASMSPSVAGRGSRAASPQWSLVPERFRGVAPSAPGRRWCHPDRDSPTEVVSEVQASAPVRARRR